MGALEYGFIGAIIRAEGGITSYQQAISENNPSAVLKATLHEPSYDSGLCPNRFKILDTPLDVVFYNMAIQVIGWEILPHLPYSFDLALTDFHIFRSLSNSPWDVSVDDKRSLKCEWIFFGPETLIATVLKIL